MSPSFRALKRLQAAWVFERQPWSYLRLVAYSFLGLSEGAESQS